MPFTLAHTVIAQPISKLTRNTLPIMALAIGSMTPDLSRLISTEFALHAHEWHEIFYQNLLFGLFLLSLWYKLYRPTLFRWFSIQDDLNIKTLTQKLSFIAYCCIALMIGNITHLIWDGFTHLDSRTLLHFEWMKYQIRFFHTSYPIHFVFQILSSIVPCAFIYWMIKAYFYKYQTKDQPSKKYEFFICLFLAMFAGGFAIMLYLKNLSFDIWQSHSYYFLGRILNKFSQAFFLIFSCCCIYFQLKYLKYKS